ncbi:MAG TPA: molybdopterin-binding protein [Candidatus Polarisedimenticolia bacterium]|nr:molybdopterin-binding protein [Candidatus Polarisedimenticolia bacterium]
MPDRALVAAEILSIGSELTVGETRDTNAGELARELSGLGVRVGRLTALPDELASVTAAFVAALERADVVVSTGGLGPTPDDLTREAISAAVGQEPYVDAALERWLRGLFDRRSIPFPETNLKQAWLIQSATAIPNANGTAPGWWVDGPDGRVIVALPGPPREMRPMWAEWVLPRLRERGLGQGMAVRVLRLAGIGESLIAERIGEGILRATNPIVATYARADAVDVRISAVSTAGRTAEALVEEMEAHVRAALDEHIWSTGDTTWGGAIEAELERLDWRLAVVEIATRGSVGALLGESVARLSFIESLPHPPDGLDRPEDLANRFRQIGHDAEVGLAVRIRTRGGDTGASIAVATPSGVHRERRVVFLDGAAGRTRAALAAADVLLRQLRRDG